MKRDPNHSHVTTGSRIKGLQKHLIQIRQLTHLCISFSTINKHYHFQGLRHPMPYIWEHMYVLTRAIVQDYLTQVKNLLTISSKLWIRVFILPTYHLCIYWCYIFALSNSILIVSSVKHLVHLPTCSFLSHFAYSLLIVSSVKHLGHLLTCSLFLWYKWDK